MLKITSEEYLLFLILSGVSYIQNFITFIYLIFYQFFPPPHVIVRLKSCIYHACAGANRIDVQTLKTSNSSRMSSPMAELLEGRTTTFCTVPRSKSEKETMRCRKQRYLDIRLLLA